MPAIKFFKVNKLYALNTKKKQLLDLSINRPIIYLTIHYSEFVLPIPRNLISGNYNFSIKNETLLVVEVIAN